MNTVRIATGAADTTRKPSQSLWRHCPWRDIAEGVVDGVLFEDDFMSEPITPATTEGNWGRYTQFSDTGGTITNDTTELGGAIAIGSDGDNEGASIRTLVTPFKISQSNLRFWFECRILSSTITDTKHNILIGLIENTAFSATVPITAAGAIADKNMVGFRRTEAASGGALIDAVYKCDGVTAVTQQAGIHTLVASTYVKLGLVFEPSGDRDGTNRLSWWVNGVRQTTSKAIPSAAGTDFPNDISLGLFFAVLNATASSPGTSSIDWWRAAQIISL